MYAATITPIAANAVQAGWLVIGTAGFIYESNNSAASTTQVAFGAGAQFVTALAYGGMQNGAPQN